MLTKELFFEQLLQGKEIPSGGWVEQIRSEAREHASILKFPPTSHDDWRLTDLSSLFKQGFHPTTSFAKISSDHIQKYLIPGTIRLVFVDGCYDHDLSDLSQAGNDVTVSSLVECFEAERFGNKLLESNFGRHAPYKQDAFVALNTNFFEDGAWVHVSGEVARPIHLIYLATKRDLPSSIYPRCMVVMDKNTSANIIEDYVGLDNGIYFSNSVTEVVLKDYAKLQHVRIQREEENAFHIGHSTIEVGRGSIYNSISLSFGGRVSRHSLHVNQMGEAAEIYLNGLTMAAGRQISDAHTFINHSSHGGKSVQLHKCIADGSAHAIFSGKILVQNSASGTDSAQSSRNLLLSDKARIDTQPQLEIFNDDVSCKHGATVGQIDADSVFFLKSRGFSEERARNLLTHAFAAEIIEKISIPNLVESLAKIILERMKKVPS